MTTRKRPSLRDNMPEGAPEGGDETARQLEQAAELEQVRRAEAAPEASKAAPKSAFEEAPSPVAALAHAYMHGSAGAPAKASGRGLGAVAAVLGLSAVGLAGVAGVLGYKDFKEGRAAVAAASAPAPTVLAAAAPATPAPPVSGTAPAAAPAKGGAATPATAPVTAAPAPAPAQAVEAQGRTGALENLGSVFSGGLTERVGAVEKQVAQISGSAQVVGILAARQLRGALADSAPFQSELALARLAGVATGDLGPALDRVAPRAAEGIPTRGELNARFAALVPAALNAELGAAGAGNGIGAVGQTMWGWVTGVAGVLRLTSAQTGEEEEGKSAAALARAGIMLEASDLSGAIERVASLEGPAAQAAAPWLTDARARAAADQASTLLANRVTELLAAAKR
ncbi:mitofilin family membrane protein [Azospirillum sp.]|uniref:mitofilin family membrane protein n=1 Tax=Azospirillum sp. TaxID=34012 RepID=UPI003D709693